MKRTENWDDRINLSLTNPDNFRRVYLDDEHSVAWDIDPEVDSKTHWMKKVDLCSDTCYMDSIPASR